MSASTRPQSTQMFLSDNRWQSWHHSSRRSRRLEEEKNRISPKVLYPKYYKKNYTYDLAQKNICSKKRIFFSEIARNCNNPLTAQFTQGQKNTKFIWVVLGMYNFDQPSKPCLPGHVWPAGQVRAAAGSHKIGLLLYFFERDSRATLSDCSWVLTIAHLMSWHKIYFHTLWNCKEAALTDDW